MRTVDHAADGQIGEDRFGALPERVQEALGELAGAAKEGLLALSVGMVSFCGDEMVLGGPFGRRSGGHRLDLRDGAPPSGSLAAHERPGRGRRPPTAPRCDATLARWTAVCRPSAGVELTSLGRDGDDGDPEVPR